MELAVVWIVLAALIMIGSIIGSARRPAPGGRRRPTTHTGAGDSGSSGWFGGAFDGGSWGGGHDGGGCSFGDSGGGGGGGGDGGSC